LSNIRVLRDLGYGTGEEAVRVLEGSPKWTPGMIDGKPVRVGYTTVIFFELGDGKPAGEQPRDGNDEGPDEAVDFTEAGQLPQFPGGGQGFAKFLSGHIRYPAEARANNITGRVIARFIVEKDGSLSDIKILRGLGYGTEEETLRVLKLSPRWTPGTKAGKPVRVTYTIPVSYELGAKWDPAILKDTQKLFVLDGRIVRPDDLEDLAADRIRAIRILDASEAKKTYGRSGKNGAVVITTKKP
ncbi:MAG TPA: energy transducer TonB, partial [Sphingobacteriaceae bacterium]